MDFKVLLGAVFFETFQICFFFVFCYVIIIISLSQRASRSDLCMYE